MTKEKKPNEIIENELDDVPIVKAETMMIISYWIGVAVLILLWYIAFCFFPKVTMFLTFIFVAKSFAEWFDKETLQEAGVKLDQVR